MLSPAPIDPTGRISRRDLSQNRLVWRAYVVLFGLFAVAAAGIPLATASYDVLQLEAYAAFLAVVSIVGARISPRTLAPGRTTSRSG